MSLTHEQQKFRVPKAITVIVRVNVLSHKMWNLTVIEDISVLTNTKNIKRQTGAPPSGCMQIVSRCCANNTNIVMRVIGQRLVSWPLLLSSCSSGWRYIALNLCPAQCSRKRVQLKKGKKLRWLLTNTAVMSAVTNSSATNWWQN